MFVLAQLMVVENACGDSRMRRVSVDSDASRLLFDIFPLKHPVEYFFIQIVDGDVCIHSGDAMFTVDIDQLHKINSILAANVSSVMQV